MKIRVYEIYIIYINETKDDNKNHPQNYVERFTINWLKAKDSILIEVLPISGNNILTHYWLIVRNSSFATLERWTLNLETLGLGQILLTFGIHIIIVDTKLQ